MSFSTLETCTPPHSTQSSMSAAATGRKTIASGDVQNLLKKQKRHFPRIISELRQCKRKTSHWAWWVWPTEKKGFSEASPKTLVTEEESLTLLQNTDEKLWTEILKELTHLIKSRDKNRVEIYEIIPSIDHGRIKYFFQFWLERETVYKDASEHYPEFTDAIRDLKESMEEM